MIEFVNPIDKKPLIRTRGFLQTKRNCKYRIKNNIPIFSSQKYVEPFGDQWKRFRKIELDSFNKGKESKNRLKRVLGLGWKNLKGKNVLEAGCGAGRFTEILLKKGAKVHAIDLSSAVFANQATAILAGANKKNYKIAQADILNLPFPNNSFDIIICLGVLQHTPSTSRSIQALANAVKPGGVLAIDHYAFHPGIFFSLYLVWWFFIKQLPKSLQNKICDSLVNRFFPIHWKFKDNKNIQKILRKVSPIHFGYPMVNSTYAFHYEWSRLVTHDRNTDFYKRHVTKSRLMNILSAQGLNVIRCDYAGNGVEALAQKKGDHHK